MKSKSFNPNNWINQMNSNSEFYNNPTQPSQHLEEILQIVEQIEENQVDITTTYEIWMNIGFAFANELGELGRDYYHRISRFNPNYSKTECDNQYNNCLNSKGEGITISSFFYYAQQAKLTLNKHLIHHNLPTIPESVYSELPHFLKEVVKYANSNEERDVLLLGSIVTLSSCLPNYFGMYDELKVFSNLNIFITAQAGAGKGRLALCKNLVAPIHNQKREESKNLKKQYDLKIEKFNNKTENDKPSKPTEKMLFIHANSSSAGVFQLLADNDGFGLIFETEGDTLTQTFKSDYGNYSDGFRKAFHHEPISYYRKTDREYVTIDCPRMSSLLTGTPKQINSLIPNAENGLFSRFIFYNMNFKPVWKDVFKISSEMGLGGYFEELGNSFFKHFESLKGLKQIQFFLTNEQQVAFNKYFEDVQIQYLYLNGEAFNSYIRRLGIVTFRLSMILSALRFMENKEYTEKVYCRDNDFECVMEIAKILLIHASKVFFDLTIDSPKKIYKNLKERFLYELPKKFNRQDYLSIAEKLGIVAKTADGYISKFCKINLIFKEKHDLYINPTGKEIKNFKES